MLPGCFEENHENIHQFPYFCNQCSFGRAEPGAERLRIIRPASVGALLARGLVDKMMLFYAPRVLGRETVPLARTASGVVNPLASLTRVQVGQSGPDFVVEGYLRDVYRDH